jgi:PAS domain S-box-containing protein
MKTVKVKNRVSKRAVTSAKEEEAQTLRQELEAERFALEVRNRQFGETCLEMEESRRWYTELFDLAPVAYFVLSLRRQIIDLNKAGIHLLQSSKESLLGEQFDLYIADDCAREFQSFCLHLLDALAVQSSEFRLRTSLGRVLDVDVMGVLSEKGKDERLLFTVHDITRLKEVEAVLRQTHDGLLKDVKDHASELTDLNVELQSEVSERRVVEKVLRQRDIELSQKHDELKALATQLITAQDMERRRLSQELHDDFSQQLASLSVDIQHIEKCLPVPDTDPGKSGLQALRRRVLQIANQVHQLAYQLHPSILDDLGLVAALRSYLSDWEVHESIKVNFNAPDFAHPTPDPIAACLYRVVQEGLRNVARHSQSSQVALTLTYDDEELSLSIRDWGIGFSKNQQDGHRGLGIWSMRERVHLVKGSFFIKSRRRQGTEILVQVPLARSSP